MSRYINADALIEEINSLSVTLCGKELFGELAKHSVVQKIDEAPTADVVELKHGEWKDRYENKYANHYYECSVCKGKALDETYVPIIGAPYCNQELSPYCPHCGASMGRREE